MTSDPARSSSPAPGSGGTPPPIPRRAPARARPVTARPSTPLNQLTVDPPEEKQEEAKGLGADNPIVLNEPAQPVVEEIAPPPVTDVVSRPGPEIIKPLFTAKVEPQEADSEVTQIAKASSPIAVVDGTTASPIDDIQHAGGDDSGLIGNQNLVGNNTWEEKTWREVVRLREEMFCARMGFVR